MSHSAQYFASRSANLSMAQECKSIRQTWRPAYILEAGLARTRWFAGHSGSLSAGIRNRFAFQWRAPCRGVCPSGRTEMLRAYLLKPDLLSEIVLLGSGALVFGSLLLMVVTAFTQA